MPTKVIETGTSTLWRREDGIVHCVFQRGTALDLEEARRQMATIRELTGGQKAPMLVDITLATSADGPARDYFASEAAAAVTVGLAFIVGSAVSRVLGAFFVGLNKPPYPVKLFTDEAAAVEWLRGLK